MVRQGIIEDLYRRNEAAMAERNQRIRALKLEVAELRQVKYPVTDIVKETAGLYPGLAYLSIGLQRTGARNRRKRTADRDRNMVEAAERRRTGQAQGSPDGAFESC